MIPRDTGGTRLICGDKSRTIRRAPKPNPQTPSGMEDARGAPMESICMQDRALNACCTVKKQAAGDSSAYLVAGWIWSDSLAKKSELSASLHDLSIYD